MLHPISMKAASLEFSFLLIVYSWQVMKYWTCLHTGACVGYCIAMKDVNAQFFDVFTAVLNGVYCAGGGGMLTGVQRPHRLTCLVSPAIDVTLGGVVSHVNSTPPPSSCRNLPPPPTPPPPPPQTVVIPRPSLFSHPHSQSPAMPPLAPPPLPPHPPFACVILLVVQLTGRLVR